MKFRKKPVVIEAEHFTLENKDRCFNFISCNRAADMDAEGRPILRIQTLEGEMTAIIGDWIIKGVKGEFYPCKNDIFKSTYEPADDEASDPDNCEGAIAQMHDAGWQVTVHDAQATTDD